MDILDNYTNKEIPFRFSGENFRFRLSHGLFSSNSVDAGTMLLLKSLAKGVPAVPPESILDAGCGTGVIGICLKRKYPGAKTILQDRDNLAVLFSEMNGQLNQTYVETRTSLLLETSGSETFDLVVSNIPAKAGATVLEKFFPAAVNLLTEKGLCAVVIVTTLAPLAEEIMKNHGLEITFRDASRQHTVFHFRSENKSGHTAPVLADYIRNHQKFRLGKAGYTLSTVYNVPDFDTPGFRLKNASKVLDRMEPSGDLLFWSPGQGHLSTACAQKGGRKIRSITLAGRDILELRISAFNLAGNGYRENPVELPLPAPEALRETRKDSVDMFVCDFSPVPESRWEEPLLQTVIEIVRPGGHFLLIGESQVIHRFFKNHKGLSVVEDYRNKGSRVILFARNS